MHRKVLVLAMAIALSFIFTMPVYCEDNPVKKLGRGIANVITAPYEIVHQSSKINGTDGPIAAATYGVLKGVGMTCIRALAGVYEVVTFPVPVPKDYKAIMTEPEFFFEDMIW